MTTLVQHAQALPRIRCGVFVAIYAAALAINSASAGDLSITSLFDGERTGQLGRAAFPQQLGRPVRRRQSFGRQFATRASPTPASASIRAISGRSAPAASASFRPSPAELAPQNTRQTRDLTRYDSFEAYVRNDTGSPLNLKYEIKDYRDNGAHQAFVNFAVPAGAGWTKITAPLDLTAPGWTVRGIPRSFTHLRQQFRSDAAIGQRCRARFISTISSCARRGPSIDLQTAPIATIADRLAERQFSGLWTARNRTTGLIYNSSDDANLAAMNTTGGVLWMLPAAVRRGWVDQADADAFVTQVVASLNTNRNLTAHVPTRFIVPATAGLPGGSNEESSIDASFMALALHHYKSQPTTAAPLAASIDAVQNRFDLDAFANPSGFRLAYFPASGFTAGTYDGYTNEGKVISLAAEVSDDHHVPLESVWNADTHRSRVISREPGRRPPDPQPVAVSRAV